MVVIFKFNRKVGKVTHLKLSLEILIHLYLTVYISVVLLGRITRHFMISGRFYGVECSSQNFYIINPLVKHAKPLLRALK